MINHTAVILNFKRELRQFECEHKIHQYLCIKYQLINKFQIMAKYKIFFKLNTK